MTSHVDFRGKSLLNLRELTEHELLFLLDLASRLKRKKKAGIRGNLLDRKNVALIFEKTSTRTRCAAAVAVADEGGRTEYLSSHDIHLGKKESAADTARVLGRMFDGILFRGYRQRTVDLLAELSGVPVWNGLTDESHPTQALADLLTIQENFGRLKGLKVVYMGDGRNNVANSLMAGCAGVGIHFVNCTPPELSPNPALVDMAKQRAALTGGSVTIVHDVQGAAEGAHAVYTDVWVSMGEEAKHAERLRLLRPYQVNMSLMKQTGHLESGQVIFLHCLPAFHDRNTDLTQDTGALEVTDEVFEAPFSRVFDEAENRLHTLKGIFVASLCAAGSLGENRMPLDAIAWEGFEKLDQAAKAPYLDEEGRLFHVLFAQQFSRRQLDDIGSLATQIRLIAKTRPGLDFLRDQAAGRRAMLYFTQPSTRTFLSFCAACQILGLHFGEVRDAATSSEVKGESQEDSVRTFSSFFDLIIMRTKEPGLAERTAWVLSNSERPVPIINAGSGRDQHPTQALLDIYTLQRSFEERGGIDGKRIVFVGDLARGRTVRSLAALLANYRDVQQCFVAPPQFQIGQDILDLLRRTGGHCELSDDFVGMIPGADAIYMTRVQDEWDAQKGESAKVDVSRYGFTARHLDLMKADAVLMHPFPRRNEISSDVDRDPRAMYWRQMRNGMWVRAALIATIFGCEAQIRKYRTVAPSKKKA